MRVVTATEASHSFAALLDEVERGETIIVTRGGRRIASIGPAAVGNGAEVIELLSSYEPDDRFADDVLAAREAVTLGQLTWRAD